jgi:hypothetical protein
MITYEGMERIYQSWTATVVKCPECGSSKDLADTDYAQDFVTYWGEDGPKEYWCNNCDHKMMVKETVMRSITLIEEDEDE